MEILFGITLFITFISLVIFGSYYISIRRELEKKGINLSYLYIWIFPDLNKFKNLLKIEKDKKKKIEYLNIYKWSINSLSVLIVFLIISIFLFNNLK